MPADPWSNAAPARRRLTPPTGNPVLPSPPRPKKPQTIPERDDLWAIYTNIMKALNALERMEDKTKDDDPEYHRVDYRLRNAYRTMTRWLNNHG